jgi:hypothetical protein
MAMLHKLTVMFMTTSTIQEEMQSEFSSLPSQPEPLTTPLQQSPSHEVLVQLHWQSRAWHRAGVCQDSLEELPRV